MTKDSTQTRARVDFDRQRALFCLRSVCDADFLFRYFYSIHSIRPFSLLYEDLESDPAGTVAELLDHCGLTSQLSPDWRRETDLSNARLKRQRDALSSELVAEFRRAFSLTKPLGS